jgi:CAP-Gly domain-containing linker protein 3/4
LDTYDFKFYPFFQEMAVVKYVGRSDFASGIWIGLELRHAKGKHDGQVDGRRYFTTKMGHGVMIRPKMVSVHGINGQDLLKPDSEYPY